MSIPKDFCIWSRNAASRIPQSEEAVRCNKLVHFTMEPALYRPVLTNDYYSDVSVGA